MTGEEVGAVVEKPYVHEPRQGPGPPLIGSRFDGRGKVRGQLVARYPGGQVEEPARLREFGHPDAIEHHDVEAGPATLEIDHEELTLLVRAPRQHFRFDADSGMLGLELGEEAGDRIHGPEDLGVLEDEDDRPVALPGSSAARQDDY